MEMSLFLASLLGPAFLVVGVGMLLNQKHYQGMVAEMKKSSLTLYLSGLMTFVLGLLMVMYHNVWVQDWTVVITVLAWLTLLKGVWLLVFPTRVEQVVKWYKGGKMLLVAVVVTLVLGAFLTNKAYDLLDAPAAETPAEVAEVTPAVAK